MVSDAGKNLEYYPTVGEVDSTMGAATKVTAVINSKKSYTLLMKSGKSVVVASWCGKCAMIAPSLR